MSESPILMKWDGDCFRPGGGGLHARRARERFKAGEQYLVSAQPEATAASRAHFHIKLKECFDSLPDHIRADHPSIEALRKFALIRSGFYDRESWIYSTPEDANTAAAAIRGRKDDIALVVVNECEVARYTAKSQRPAVMGNEEFQASKVAVLAYCNKLLGVE